MKRLVCEMCGSTDMIKEEGSFICQSCGTKYSVEEAKKMMVEIEGTVDVQGTVKVDNSAIIAKHLINAHRALVKEDWEEVEKYYNLVEQNSPDNIEAVFFSSYGKAMLAMTDSDYFKREQKFQVLNRSMSVISDYYDTTTENKEESLRKIAEYIQKMYNVTFVYQRQSLDLGGAIRSLGAATGTRQWCINLINTTKSTFISELRQIAAKHDDQFIKDIIKELEPQDTVTQTPTPKPTNETPAAPQDSEGGNKKVSIAMIFGIIGIVFAWLFALIGHVVSIIGIVIGVKEKKETGKSTGLIISVIGEICAVISSLIGVISML